MKQRLDQSLVIRGLAPTRSQAEGWIKLGEVKVGGEIITKPGYFVSDAAEVVLVVRDRYVSRAGLKLASVAASLGIDFEGKVVLDVGSSTGGFTDYALQHGASMVIAVDVGTEQLHPSLRNNPLIELHEQTDIRDMQTLTSLPDIVVIDVSFISLREILPHIATLIDSHTKIAAMFKPQFEAGGATKHKGVIKNDALRRQILRDFEQWAKQYFIVQDKADSEVAGARGNRERFYLLQKIRTS